MTMTTCSRPVTRHSFALDRTGGRHRRPGRPRRLPRLAILATLLAIFASAAMPGTARGAPSPQGRLSWPLSPAPSVTRYFEPPSTPYGPGHRGVDLAAAPGTNVLAAAEGVVMFAGQVAGRGVVSIDHEGGLRTTYQPLAPTVTAGDQVYRGQVLGTLAAGHPGCPEPACLHFGVRRGEEYVDPLALIGEPSEIRLKPWEGD
ncbi:murein hydrolase activator EnvC family protein [Amycolatopsis keratiniphila]|uniref:Peptidase n=1 Tax=Amycolatopsis keratiniphila subsp. keratiniphila TaxID=227715 RepID=A0A1W2LYN8_9PSEU|nr:M23 family metallopeptidase [Amycolatopsis keratiniphila]OLZ43987.1 peptidase [Amycolatopsis keratiniphila subsp. nogabecina]ONF72336.1 peptidase [Amycolatopsis keratiniphila subsp. keratiniphila]